MFYCRLTYLKTIWILFLYSVTSHSATVELGATNYQYNKKYNTSDSVSPYIATHFKPFSESLIDFYLKYDYQYQYGKKKIKSSSLQFKTKRTRFYFIVEGVKMEQEKYRFTPKFGFKYEQWKVNYSNPIRQNSKKLELRFYPNMNYQLSTLFSIYMNGFIAPVINEVQQTAKSQVTKEYYYHNYYQELQLIGIKYNVTDKNSFWTSIYNEIKYQEHFSKYQLWQLRLGYHWHITPEFNFSPYFRQDLYHKEKNIQIGTQYGSKKRKNASKIGAILTYKINPRFTAISEIYYQVAKNQDYQGAYSKNKNHAFYKLGFRINF